jgi:hypothetical protein
MTTISRQKVRIQVRDEVVEGNCSNRDAVYFDALCLIFNEEQT